MPSRFYLRRVEFDMSVKKLLAAVAVGTVASLAVAAPAAAFGLKWDPSVAPEGYEPTRVIHHWVYKPRFAHFYHGDPYKYRYARRGYYPYYNSQYWVPAAEMRYRYRYTYEGPKYTYHPAWGAPTGHVGPRYDGRPVK
jgi:hypothetical protein